ncbi:hypothetical protein [Streptomyces sp. NPDC005374]|uniref:hypothetical protein n=1 Tax=Streptomyces sp. NPDC005374 TaxID=3364713 RepID=UPI003675A7C8
MSRPNTRHLDREIALTERKLEAVRNEELWPLTGSERRQVLGALASGSYRTLRSKSTGRAERTLDRVRESVLNRLNAELAAFQKERGRLVAEAATAKAVKKSSSWW